MNYIDDSLAILGEFGLVISVSYEICNSEKKKSHLSRECGLVRQTGCLVRPWNMFKGVKQIENRTQMLKGDIKSLKGFCLLLNLLTHTVWYQGMAQRSDEHVAVPNY